MMVVWVAWHRLTILGGGAVCGGTAMGLGKKSTNDHAAEFSIVCQKIHNVSVINRQ